MNLVCNEVAKGVGQINLTSDIQLCLRIYKDIEQAIERSGSKAGNKQRMRTRCA